MAAELTDTRSPEEDRLRLDLLSVFQDARDIAGAKELLNAPWSRATVLGLEELAVRRLTGRDSWPSAHYAQATKALALLAWVCSNSDARTAVAEVLERGFARASGAALPDTRSKTWCVLVDEIEYHGSSELLTPSFWDGYRKGLPARKVLAAVADASTLDHLRSISIADSPPADHLAADELRYSIRINEVILKFPEEAAKIERRERLRWAEKRLLRMNFERLKAGG